MAPGAPFARCAIGISHAAAGVPAGQALGVADCQATMIAHEVEKLRGNFRQAAHQQPFTLNFRAQSKHLAL